MDIKKLLSIVDNNGAQQKAVITESVSAPTVSKTEQYFKAVNNEVLQNIKEQQAQKTIEVKRVVSRVLDKLEEGKTTKDKPAVRNFVAKNAPKAGAGAHKDKKKAEKQGDIKHKKELVPMDEERTEVRDKDGKVTSWKDEGEWKKSTEKKDARGKVTNLSDKARRETEKLSKKEKEVSEVAGAQKCWPGHRKVGTQPGTGKNAGKRVNDCEKIKEGRNREDDWDEGNTEPPNNFAIYINGKKWKVLAGRGQFADDYKERNQYRQLQNWAQEKSASTGKEWKVYVTGEPVSEQLAESYGSVEVGSPVKVYSNVLKKTVFGKVVKLHEGTAHVQYNNTKIVMRHPVKEVAAAPVASTVAKAAPSVAGKMASRLIPGVGLAVSGYDAYDRAKKGDYAGAALSGAAGLASLIPGIGTAATVGLTGAQLARDYKKKTGAFAPDDPAPAQAATPAGKYPTTDAEIKAFQTANKLTPDGKIGPKTQAALNAAGLKKPAQAATPAPAAAPGSNVAAAVRSVAPAASAIAQQALK
jgi:peptidoglycan hydrolase-like protein with peptidoglycan-binding domain